MLESSPTSGTSILDLPLPIINVYEAIQTESARRDLMRDTGEVRERCLSLYEFVKASWHIVEPFTPFVGGWAIEAMCHHLEAVTRGEIQYLLINVPPGMMKSLLVAVFWPAWEWGPMGMQHLRYLTSSFSESNVLRDNRKMRQIIESEWYQALWPEVVLSRDQNAKHKFENVKKGFREGRAFQSMTGGRGDRVIIDDPHSVETAESEVEREKTVLLFRESITDRLNDIRKSAIVIIMQRLHEADVSGIILSLKMPYVHLCLPMEFDPARRCETHVDGRLFFRDHREADGELLFPERFPSEELERLALAKGQYAYAGQYQQLPAPREGGMFKVDQILPVDAVPKGGLRVRGWDIAGSERKNSAYTAGARLCIVDSIIYIEHVSRARAEVDKAVDLIAQTAEWDGGDNVRQHLPQDPGVGGKALRNLLASKMAGLDFGFSAEIGSKHDRAIPFAAMVNSGMVRIARGDWNAELLAELRLFPGSQYKDQVDALSRAYAEILRLTKTRKRQIAPPEVLRAHAA